MAQFLCKIMDGVILGQYAVRISDYAPHRVLRYDCPVTDEYRIDTDDWMEEFFGVRELEDMQVIIVNETLVCMNRPTAARLRAVSGDAFAAIFKVANMD